MTDMSPLLQKIQEYFSENDLRILFRLRNSELVYTIEGRPSPATSGITSGALVTIMTDAWGRLPLKRIPRGERIKALNYDGNEVSYTDVILFSWRDGNVRSTRGRKIAAKVLNGVAMDLAKEAAAEAKGPTPKDLN